MMQAHNSKQALNNYYHHVQPSKMKVSMETPLLMGMKYSGKMICHRHVVPMNVMHGQCAQDRRRCDDCAQCMRESAHHLVMAGSALQTRLRAADVISGIY